MCVRGLFLGHLVHCCVQVSLNGWENFHAPRYLCGGGALIVAPSRAPVPECRSVPRWSLSLVLTDRQQAAKISVFFTATHAICIFFQKSEHTHTHTLLLNYSLYISAVCALLSLTCTTCSFHVDFYQLTHLPTSWVKTQFGDSYSDLHMIQDSLYVFPQCSYCLEMWKKPIIAKVVHPLSLQTNKQDTVDDWMNTTVKSKDSAATRTLFLERDVSAFLMNVSRRCEHLKCSSVHLQCTEVRAEISDAHIKPCPMNPQLPGWCETTRDKLVHLFFVFFS